MLFNSPEFIFLFLPITFFSYFFLLRSGPGSSAKLFLIAASLFFYSWWNPVYLPLIVGSMVFNFSMGSNFGESESGAKKHRLYALAFGICCNLALLAYFKYADFFIQNYNLALDTSHSLLNLTLPLAISFFTFQQIAYLVDSYRGETREYGFLNYALFVSFFPQLIAGPIVHHKEMMPQFFSSSNWIKNYDHIASGLFILSVGLFKKVALADTFALWATPGFDQAQSLTLVEAWSTSLSYTFQLYFDFSGYSDMAIGIALLFNIRLPVNFNSPYKARNIQDFWRRWHMTLSRFLRDYVYIGLGGNRQGNIQLYTNLMVTFLVGGLWHGADWNFVFWGFLHGAAQLIHRFWQRLGCTIPRVLAWFITFQFINVTWVFFRATSFDDAIKVLSGMTGLNGVGTLPQNCWIYLSIIAALLVVGLFPNSLQLFNYPTLESRKHYNSIIALGCSLLFFASAILMSMSRHSEFIYFNF